MKSAGSEEIWEEAPGDSCELEDARISLHGKVSISGKKMTMKVMDGYNSWYYHWDFEGTEN